MYDNCSACQRPVTVASVSREATFLLTTDIITQLSIADWAHAVNVCAAIINYSFRPRPHPQRPYLPPPPPPPPFSSHKHLYVRGSILYRPGGGYNDNYIKFSIYLFMLEDVSTYSFGLPVSNKQTKQQQQQQQQHKNSKKYSGPA